MVQTVEQSQPGIALQLPSVQSLFLELYFNDKLLASATGFVVEAEERNPYLITNRHNVTGRYQKDDKPMSSTGAVPNKIKIFHHTKKRLGEWCCVEQSLYKNSDSLSEPLWKEHPRFGAKADVVALPLVKYEFIQLYPYQLGNDFNIAIAPAEVVSVIGFPYGGTGGGYLGVWSTGYIATEPAIDYGGMPRFLIDCRSRKGQSGSPVVAHRNSIAARQGGGLAVYSGPVTQFLGVYSGRINVESDLGYVWKASVIQDIITS